MTNMADTDTGTELTKLLMNKGACDEAIAWVGGRTLAEAWTECHRGDWMLWLAGKMGGEEGWPTRQQLVLAACVCAELSLPYVPTGEERPRQAIEAARRWVRGEATIEEVRASAAASAASAASATSAAAYAAYAAYAASAASAAASAASAASATSAAAYAAYAAYAASAANAADAAASAAAARTKTLGQCADIARSMLIIPTEAVQ